MGPWPFLERGCHLGELEGKIRPSFVLADRVDRNNVWVAEPGDGLRPRPEPSRADRGVAYWPSAIVLIATTRPSFRSRPCNDAHSSLADQAERLMIREREGRLVTTPAAPSAGDLREIEALVQPFLSLDRFAGVPSSTAGSVTPSDSGDAFSPGGNARPNAQEVKEQFVFVVVLDCGVEARACVSPGRCARYAAHGGFGLKASVQAVASRFHLTVKQSDQLIEPIEPLGEPRRRGDPQAAYLLRL